MSDLRIQVEANYSEVTKLQSKIEELKGKIANFNPTITPRADLTKMQNELAGAQAKFTEVSTRLGLIGNASAKAGQSIGKFSEASSSAARKIAEDFKKSSSAVTGFNEDMTKVASGIGGIVKQYSAASLAMMGIYKAVNLLRTSFSTITDFQAANSNLQAILGATDAQMEGFRETAEKLGRVTVYTAAQVTSLQTALAKLGFDEGNIHAMEKDVLSFAQATGASLDDAAETTGAALRMFQVQSDQYEQKTKEFTNAMAAATMSSALDFRMIRDNLATFGPMAKAMGFQIEDVLALFGKLKDNGVEASTAMTSLRNIFTKMAQGKIGGLSASTNNLDDFVAGLKELQGLDTGKGMKMIGPRGGTQFITLINQADSILALRDKIKASMSGDTTGEMSEKMVNNLNGQLKMLQSAWEDFVLAFRNSDGVIKETLAGVTDMIMKTRDFIAGNGDFTKEQIDNVLSAVKVVVAAIAAMKATSLVGTAGRAIKDKVNDMRDTVEAEQLRQKGAAMASAAGLSDRLTASEGRRTAAMKASIAALAEEINLERSRVLSEMKLTSVLDDANMKALRRAETELRTCEERIALYRRLGQEQIASAARFQSIGNTVAQEKALQSADKYAQLETNAMGELRQRRTKVTNAENAVLSGGGRQDLVNINNIEASGRAMSKTAKMARSLKMGLEGIIGVPINPITLGIAAITALGFAIYKVCTYKTDLEKLNESVSETMDKVSETAGQTSAKMKTYTSILENGSAGAESYIKSLEELKKIAEQYGVTIDTIRDKETGVEKITNLADARRNLAAAIREEADANAYLAGMNTINENEDTKHREYSKELKVSLVDVDSTGVLATYGEELTENAQKAQAAYSALLEKYQQLAKETDHMTANATMGKELEEAKNHADEAMAALSARAKVFASNMGKSKEETDQFVQALQMFATKMGILQGDSMMAKEALDKARTGIEGLGGSFSLAERKAMNAKKSVSALKEEIAKVAKDHRVNIKIDFEGQPPKWMKNLGWDSSKYQQAAAWWKSQADDMISKGQKFRVVGKQKYSLQQIMQKSTDYANTSETVAQTEKEKPTEAHEETAEEKKARLKAEKAAAKAAAAAEKKRKLREKLHNELVQMQLKNDDEEIAIEDEGISKKIEKRDQQFRKEMEQLRKQAKEWADSNKKADVTGTTSQVQVWDNEGREETVKGLTGDQAAAITKRKALLDQSREKDKAEIFKDYDPAAGRKEKEAKLTRDIEAMEKSIKELETDGSNEAAENMKKRLQYAQAMLKVSQSQSQVEWLKGSSSMQMQHEGNLMDLANERSLIDPSDTYALMDNDRKVEEEDTRYADEMTRLNTGVEQLWQNFASLSQQALTELQGQLKDAVENGVNGKHISEELKRELESKLSDIKVQLETGGRTGGMFGDSKFFGAGGVGGGSWIGDVGQNLKKINETQAKAKADNAKWEQDKQALQAAKDNQSALTDKYNEAKGAGDMQKAAQLQQQLAQAQTTTQAAQGAANASGAAANASGALAGAAGAAGGAGMTEAIIKGVNANVQSFSEAAQYLWDKDSDAYKGVQKFAESSQYAVQGFDSLKNGDLVGTVLNVGKAISSLGESFGLWSNSNREETEAANEKLAASQSVLVEALDHLTEQMKKQSGSEAYTTKEAALRALDTQKQNAQKTMQNNAGMHDGGHSLNYDYNNNGWSRIANVNLYNQLYKATGNSKYKLASDVNWENLFVWKSLAPTLQDVLAIDPKDLEKLYKTTEGQSAIDAIVQELISNQDDGNYNGMSNDWLDYISTYGQDAYDAIEDEFYETVNGLSFDSFRDNFLSMMMDLESEVDDFGDNFTEQLTKSVMNDYLKEEYNDRIEDLYKQWGDLVKKRTDGSIDTKEFEKQATALQDAEATLSAELIAKRDEIAAMTGYSENESQKATRSSIENITQDQADQLIGRITAMQIAVEASNANTTVGTTILSTIQTQLASMASEQLNTRLEFTNQMADAKNIMAQSYIELRGINTNTEAIVEPIKSMQDDMYRMRQKIDTL